MAQHKTSDAVASLMRKRLLEGDRQYALANLRPAGVRGPAANAAHGAQRRRAKLAEPAIGERLDLGDPFENALEEGRFVARPRLKARRERGVVHGKAFAGIDKRIVIEPRGPVGFQGGGERRETISREQALDHFPAGVGRPACKPSRADAVAVDPKLSSEDRPLAQAA